MRVGVVFRNLVEQFEHDQGILHINRSGHRHFIVHNYGLHHTDIDCRLTGFVTLT